MTAHEETGVWESRHLHHDGDSTALLQGSIREAAKLLSGLPEVTGFFFVRYRDETGPHLRLRFRFPESVEEAGRRRLIEGLPGLREATTVPFEPEVERYGGLSALGFSLDYFSLSSAHALDYVASYGDRPKNRQLPLCLCLLLWQAWGFARDGKDLLGLFQYRSGEGGWEPAVERADRSFDEDPGRWLRLVEGQLESLAAAADEELSFADLTLGASGSVAVGSRLLRRALEGLDAPVPLGIGTSQLHMTANRLGLSNGEENFVVRLAERSLMALGEADRLGDGLERSWERPGAGRLEELVPRHFAALG